MNKTIPITGPTQEQKDKITYLESLGLIIESFTSQSGECTVYFTDDYDYEISTNDFEIGDSLKEIYNASDIYSCCGDILDRDYMICPTCKEHC